MLGCFNDLGYSLEWRVINASEYSFAQHRRRTFIFAYKDNTTYYENMRNQSYKDIICDRGFFATNFSIERDININRRDFNYEDIYDISDNFECEFLNSGMMINGEIAIAKSTPIF